ncbi:DUF1553 domain-containing protein [Botrimarina colliarenosi]|uniref:DUF1553 domain-containing protein n=1 Tax=Botrimarina colliarenosi TaxID=2528001 RepID=UPI0018D2D900|nr:DUF1553 domain-containing protein [Botrimarina colliarenosi]
MVRLAFIAIAVEAAAADSVRDFAHKVQPILSNKCFHCHGPDEAIRPTELRLDTEEGVRDAFAGGDLQASEAWRRILSDDPYEVMPPPEAHKPFSDAERETIRAWAEAGADWSPHWAFARPVKVTPPAEAGMNAIDAFVRHRLARAGLTPAPRASKENLLRRVTLDLHGLPPTLEELDAFLADDAPGAWNRVIDRLLASPRYGERMAVAWLDGARYADTNGYQNDFKRTMWPWRDWVIDAFNANQRFDQFAIEQLAGDLLPDPTHEQRLATAFNRNNRTVTEAGSIPEEWLVENVVDRVETTSAVFLGLTMGCARCHDHKFDPITQKEFFEFFAFFSSVDEMGVYNETRGNVGPSIECPSESERTEFKRLDAWIDDLSGRLEEMRSQVESDAAAWYANTTPPETPPAVSAVRLDRDTYAGVANGEWVVEPGPQSKPPKLDDSFLGATASFDGSQWLEYEGLFEPERDRPMTVLAWVQRRGGGAVLSKMHDANDYRGIDWLFGEDGKLMVHLIGRWPDDAVKVVTKESLPAGRWTPVTVSYDGSGKAAGVTICFGLDKQEFDIDKDCLTGSLQTDQPFRVGRRSSGGGFQGSVARLRIFHRALSDEEIRARISRDLLTSPYAGGQVSGRPDTSRGGVGPEQLAQYVALAPDGPACHYAAANQELEAARREMQAFRDGVPTCMVMQELPEPRPTFVLKRGEYDKPDKDQPVSPATPRFLHSLPTRRRDRLALAEWIVSRDNPLTARVIVNRMWGRFFGIGIVKSEENFGVQSDTPTHPDLLDWLAVEFMDSGWDLQHVIRLILTSETYRQASAAAPEAYANDPENRLLARGPRRRLPAEFVRDNALAVSNLLSPRIGGPSVFPYQPEGLWEELAGGASQGAYPASVGEDLYRRSLYTYRKRTVPHPTMATFDAPSFEICTVKRSTTNTPLQALALLNDVTYVEAARKLGERMLREGGDADTSRLHFGFRLATSRAPSAEEIQLLTTALDKYRQRAEADPAAATQRLAIGAAPTETSLPPTELAAYMSLGSLLLNLDETITVE